MIEIWCNFKQSRIKLEDCIKCGKCLPPPIIKQLAKDFIFEENRYGVTELVGCLRKSFFLRKSPTYPTLPDLYVYGRGLAFHYWFGRNFQVKELKLVKRFNDFDIVGMPDAIEQGDLNTLFEFKSISHIPIAPYPQHKLQIQGYYSLAKERIEIDRLVIIYFTMNSFKWFEVEKADIMDFLEKNARILHECLKTNKIPEVKDESFCNFCPFNIDCKLYDLGVKK